MDVKNFKHFIVVDDIGKPMAWSESSKQLCYCNSLDWGDEAFPLKIVKLKTAKEQIKKTIENRKKLGYLNYINYKIMPVII